MVCTRQNIMPRNEWTRNVLWGPFYSSSQNFAKHPRFGPKTAAEALFFRKKRPKNAQFTGFIGVFIDKGLVFSAAISFNIALTAYWTDKSFTPITPYGRKNYGKNERQEASHENRDPKQHR